MSAMPNPAYSTDGDERNSVNTDDDDEETPILHTASYKQSTTCYVYMLSLFAAIGGFLFGYDTGVISGAMIPIKDKFSLSKEMQELVVSITLGGAIFGALTTSIISERFGRRIVMLVASCVFTIGAVIMGAAKTTAELLIGRLVVGLGIGYASTTVPVYIAEAAPAHIRGQLVTLNQLFITFGQFAASAINGAFSYMSDGWRYMLGVASIPSFILFVGFIFMPESPRWLISKGRLNDARKVLHKLRGQEDNEQEIVHIEEHNSKATDIDSDSSWKRVFTTKATRRALILGCGLQAFQQLSGINTVMYYSGTIIQMAGVKKQTTVIWYTAAVAGGNFVFTLFSMMIVEKFGRRKLTLSSIFGVCLALCLLGGTFIVLKDESTKTSYNPVRNQSCGAFDSCYSCVDESNCGFCYVQNSGKIFNGSCLAIDKHFNENRSPFCNSSTYAAASKGEVEWREKVCPTSFAWLAVIAMIFYLAMFAPGLGPMPWAINAEIYPLWARSIGTSASTATNWTLNLVVSLTFLNLLDALTRPGAFFFYAGITFCGFIFLFILLPETKGKKLEEVEELFDGPVCIPCRDD